MSSKTEVKVIKQSIEVTPLASFGDISELAINMPGCKMLLHYVDKSGNESSLSLVGVRSITIETDAPAIDLKDMAPASIATKKGSIVVKGKKAKR